MVAAIADDTHIVWIGIAGLLGSRAFELEITNAAGMTITPSHLVRVEDQLVQYVHVLPSESPLRIVARQKDLTGEVPTIEVQRTVTITPGYPASVYLYLGSQNTVWFSEGDVWDEATVHLADRRATPLAALVPVGVSDHGEYLGELFTQLEREGVLVDRAIRFTRSGRAFFKMDVRHVKDAGKILDLIIAYQRGLETLDGWNGWRFAVSLNADGPLDRLLVFDVRETDPAPGQVHVLESISVGTVRPEFAVDDLIRRIGGIKKGPQTRLTYEREASRRKPRPPDHGKTNSPVRAGSPRELARQGGARQVQRAMNVSAPPWSVATIEFGPVTREHPWVDRCRLSQYVLCDSQMEGPISDSDTASICADRITVDTRIHATAVYGMHSALETAQVQCNSSPSSVGAGAPTPNPMCAIGGVPDVTHIALAIPATIDGMQLDAACFLIGDALRWLSGLPTSGANPWMGLATQGVQPARVINISRRFAHTLKAIDNQPDSAGVSYLKSCLEAVTHSSHSGKGAVVVATPDNADRAFMENQLSLPCRNPILWAGACKAFGAGIGSGELAWSPLMSLVAPSNDVKLLSVPGSGSDECGNYVGPSSSFSGPQVAVAAAKVLMERPDLAAARVAELLRRSARVVDVQTSSAPDEIVERPEDVWFAMSPDRTRMVTLSAGSHPEEGEVSCPPNATHCWTSLRYGHGVIDVAAALESLE